MSDRGVEAQAGGGVLAGAEESIIEAARREAAAVVEAAEAEASAAGETYTAAWNAAKDAGWTPAQLRSMGYSKPPASRKTAPRNQHGRRRKRRW